MNPTFTVSIDLEKRKTSAVGLVAVGEKVDVVISGVDVTSIPEWEEGNDEGFSGPALRFRIVAPDGKDLVRYPLVEGDGWNIDGASLSAEVDFNTMQLRGWLRGFSINEKAEVGIIVDSVVDAMEYGRGTVKILQWMASPADDPMILPDWRKTLRDLNAAIVEVGSKADAATSAATIAETARDEAQAFRSDAESFANNALSSANAAIGFKNEANSAAARAAQSEAGAEEARDEMNAAIDRMEVSAERVAGGVSVMAWDGKGDRPEAVIVHDGEKGDKGDKGDDALTEYVYCEEDQKFYRLTAVDSPNGSGKVLALSQVPSEEFDPTAVVKTVNNLKPDSYGNVTLPLNFLPLSGGKMTSNIGMMRTVDDGFIGISGGSEYHKGAILELLGKDHPSGEEVRFTVHDKEDSTKRKQLRCYSNGSLVWDGKEVERVIESSFSGSSYYIRFASGLMIQGGVMSDVAANTETFVTYNKAFSVSAIISVISTDMCGIAVYGATTTSFKCKHNHSAATYIRWIAIGK